MNRRSKINGLFFVSLLSCALAAPAFAANRQPTVVELFTSQGCSSCPPANANLITISKNPDVLALSFAVTYWDRLGWKDTFGRPEFTERQITYEPALNQDSAFTPQVVVNGSVTGVGNSLPELQSLMASAPALSGPAMVFGKGRIEIGNGPKHDNAEVWLVNYDPRTVSTRVGSGENGGVTLLHANVVHHLEKLGTWNGQSASFQLPLPRSGMKAAVLLQRPNGGKILSAITQ